MPDIQLLLGPLLGFLFTAGTLLFVALNAHMTAAPAQATATGPDTAAAAETPPAAPQPAQEAPPSDQP